MDYKEIYNQWLENPYFDEAKMRKLPMTRNLREKSWKI